METFFCFLLVLKSTIISFVCVQDEMPVLTPCNKVIGQFPVLSLLFITDASHSCRLICVFLEMMELRVILKVSGVQDEMKMWSVRWSIIQVVVGVPTCILCSVSHSCTGWIGLKHWRSQRIWSSQYCLLCPDESGLAIDYNTCTIIFIFVHSAAILECSCFFFFLFTYSSFILFIGPPCIAMQFI